MSDAADAGWLGRGGRPLASTKEGRGTELSSASHRALQERVRDALPMGQDDAAMIRLAGLLPGQPPEDLDDALSVP